MIHDTRLTPNGIATAADEQAVRDLFRLLLDAWGAATAPPTARFTEDADYVAFDGSNRRGTRAIATEHQQLFDTWLKGTRLVGRSTASASSGRRCPRPRERRHDLPGPEGHPGPGARRSRRSSPSVAPMAGLALHRLPQHPDRPPERLPVDALRALLPPVRP